MSERLDEKMQQMADANNGKVLLAKKARGLEVEVVALRSQLATARKLCGKAAVYFHELSNDPLMFEMTRDAQVELRGLAAEYAEYLPVEEAKGAK